MDYSSSGVNIERADQLVNWLKNQPPLHHKQRIVSGVGGFASIFQIHFPNMKEPCLASSADGVGTKLKLAVQYRSLKSLGQDLVAMCVNDLLCTGAVPLFFLDYYACGRLDEKKAQTFLEGVQTACGQAQCALIGGETAEMPSLYKAEDFDCAGFAVGIVDRKDILGACRVKKGDRLLALPSSGFHSNGYSLLRKVFEKDMDQWAETLLTPTALYTSVFQSVLKNRVRALAHITGGGLNNILRAAPKGSVFQLQPWPVPECFLEVRKRADLSWEQLFNTFNCGVGLTALVAVDQVQPLLKDLKDFGMQGWEMGELVDIKPDQDSLWQTDWNQWSDL